MKIYDILKEDHIFLDLKQREKRKVIQELVSRLKETVMETELTASESLILDELLNRENLCSTGLEKGIAVPHAFLDEVRGPILALGVSKKGVNFEAADQKPTHIVLILLGNKNNPGFHLKLLAHICRLIKETRFVDRVKKAKTPSSIHSILKEEEDKI